VKAQVNITVRIGPNQDWRSAKLARRAAKAGLRGGRFVSHSVRERFEARVQKARMDAPARQEQIA